MRYDTFYIKTEAEKEKKKEERSTAEDFLQRRLNLSGCQNRKNKLTGTRQDRK